MNEAKKLPPTILVVFGITGDLSHRYLLPALKEIIDSGNLPETFKVIGVSRREISLDDIFSGDEKELRRYTEPLQIDLDSSAGYAILKNKIEETTQKFGVTPEVIYYLSVPPQGVLPIIQSLGEAGLNLPKAKLLLEKPFGVDLDSARELIGQIAKHFPERQVYRIDHYLAKEMAQNIVVFLGSNSLFRNVWNNRFIDSIEIEACEQIGIAGRSDFYDSTGALRDITQSHLLQLAALTLMEPCSDIFDFEELPMHRLAALNQLKVDGSSVVRAQYSGYKDEVQNPESKTETFVSLTLQSSDPHWTNVPVHLVTGKNLREKITQIRVCFKKTHDTEANVLTLRIQPREGIELNLWVKQPGYARKLQKLPLKFSYEQHFERLPDAYEQVLVDAMDSNHSLFAGSDEVLASWKILQPVLDEWSHGSDDLIIYESGSELAQIQNINKS